MLTPYKGKGKPESLKTATAPTPSSADPGERANDQLKACESSVSYAAAQRSQPPSDLRSPRRRKRITARSAAASPHKPPRPTPAWLPDFSRRPPRRRLGSVKPRCPALTPHTLFWGRDAAGRHLPRAWPRPEGRVKRLRTYEKALNRWKIQLSSYPTQVHFTPRTPTDCVAPATLGISSTSSNIC